jgi:hypothetical protein
LLKMIFMSSVQKVSPGRPGVAGMIRLAIPLGALALATVLLGILAPPVFFCVYALADLVFFVTFYRRLFSLPDLGVEKRARWIVGMMPVGCCALLLAVLCNWADREVRNDGALQAAFVIAWGCVVIWTQVGAWLLGLDVLEHGVEGRNPAAVWAGAGLMLGATLAAAGANVGQGPTEATTLGPMFLAVGGLMTFWGAFSMITRSVAAVTVERDQPSGLRTAALVVALGLILGRSVAGDWVSVGSTLRDFWQQGLKPAATLIAVAAVIEFLERPSTRRPVTSFARSGVAVAILYLGFAAAWLWHLGVKF